MSKKPPSGRFEHLEFDEPQRRQPKQQAAPQTPGELRAETMDRHEYHGRALEAFHRGDFEKALRFYTRTLELDRAFVPAWVGQVQMLIELDELREADLWADKALELFHDQGELLATKGVAKARRREYRAAMGCSDASLAVAGSSAYRWLARGEILLARGESNVTACFDRAFLEPDADGHTRVWAARIYRRYGWETQAALMARQATEAVPHAPYAWYIRGLCERELGVIGYRNSLQRALQVDATFTLARDALDEKAGARWISGWWRRLRGH